MIHAAGEIFINLIAVFIVFIARLLGLDIYSRLLRGARHLGLTLTNLHGTQTVVVYTDCDDELHTTRALSAGLVEALKELGVRTRSTVVRHGDDLLRLPLSHRRILGILLLLTDVTQFTSRPKDRARLQERLVKYVHGGGCLVLGHDVLYRRTRNERLQKLAGCQLTSFHGVDDPVEYVKVSSGARATDNAALLAVLPDSLALGDNEVVSGTWMQDVEYLYVWQADSQVPLLTRRPLGDGVVFWLNSGDQNAVGPPRAIARPEPGLVQLLARLLELR